MLSPFAHVIDAWLRAELLLKGMVIHERLVEQYGFTGTYQRVKLYLSRGSYGLPQRECRRRR